LAGGAASFESDMESAGTAVGRTRKKPPRQRRGAQQAPAGFAKAGGARRQRVAAAV